MRIPLHLIIATLLVSCSDDAPPPQVAAKPTQVAAEQQPAAKKADFAAAETAPKTDPKKDDKPDPCDLRGYDMSQMTVDRHEELVKICNDSKR